MQLQWRDMLQDPSAPRRVAGVLDSAHVAGMLVNCFLTLGLGFCNYLVPGSNINLLLEIIVKEKVNYLMAVPPVYQRLTSHPQWNTADLSSVKHAVSAAAPATPEILRAVTAKLPMGAFCQQGWGMTELTCLATMPQPGVLGPWDSVGKPLAGNAIKIFNEMGVEVPQGEVGEIYVSGKGERLSTSPT